MGVQGTPEQIKKAEAENLTAEDKEKSDEREAMYNAGRKHQYYETIEKIKNIEKKDGFIWTENGQIFKYKADRSGILNKGRFVGFQGNLSPRWEYDNPTNDLREYLKKFDGKSDLVSDEELAQVRSLKELK